MSKFTQKVADNIAFLSFRAGKRESDAKPLSGKETALKEALQRAEIAHDAELDRRNKEFEASCRDVEMFKKHEEFYQYFSEALKHWREMKEPIKEALIRYTQNHLQTIEETRNTIPLARLRKRCDDTLEAIALAAHQEAVRLKGRRSGISQSVGHANISLRPLMLLGAN